MGGKIFDGILIILIDTEDWLPQTESINTTCPFFCIIRCITLFISRDLQMFFFRA